jgi:uroporphyrinogen-III synthase
MPADAGSPRLDALKVLLASAQELTRGLEADPAVRRVLQALATFSPEERQILATALEHGAARFRINESFARMNGVRLRLNPHPRLFVRVVDTDEPEAPPPLEEEDIVPDILRLMRRVPLLLAPESSAIWRPAVLAAFAMLSPEGRDTCRRFVRAVAEVVGPPDAGDVEESSAGPDGDDARALAGLRVVAFEARRAVELARMLERHGATVLSAPALREAALPPSPATAELARALSAGAVTVLVLLTGVGTRALAAQLSAEGMDATALFGRTRIVARGPKPLAALRELGVPGAIAVPTPNTWREVLATLDDLDLPAGGLVAVQEYGGPPEELLRGLAARGHRVLAIPVYRWELPADTTALRQGIAEILAGTIDVAVFTSATQIEHAFRVAADPTALRDAFRRVVVASVGPVCSEALEAHGVAVDFEADPPKMGPLVALTAARARALKAAKVPR